MFFYKHSSKFIIIVLTFGVGFASSKRENIVTTNFEMQHSLRVEFIICTIVSHSMVADFYCKTTRNFTHELTEIGLKRKIVKYGNGNLVKRQLK